MVTITKTDENTILVNVENPTGDLSEVLGLLDWGQGVMAALKPPDPAAPPPFDIHALVKGIHTDGALRVDLAGGRELKITAAVNEHG